MEKFKKYLTILIVLCGLSNTYAQKYKNPQNLPFYDHKKLHFGFILGINSLNFKAILLLVLGMIVYGNH